MKTNETENAILDKSYAFAIRIVKVCRILNEEKREFILSKQLLRSGTSIGAIVEEAIDAQSEKDFYAKLTIAYKEARETKYWLRLLTDTGYLNIIDSDQLISDDEELLQILGSIQKTLKIKMNSNSLMSIISAQETTSGRRPIFYMYSPSADRYNGEAIVGEPYTPYLKPRE